MELGDTDGEPVWLWTTLNVTSGLADTSTLVEGSADGLKDISEDAVRLCVELGDTDDEAVRVHATVKLPSEVPDASILPEAGADGLKDPVKLCRELGDSSEDAVSDCVEVGDIDGEPVRLCGEEDIVPLGHAELLAVRDATALYVFAEGDVSEVKLRVTDPLRVPLVVDDAHPDRETV